MIECTCPKCDEVFDVDPKKADPATKKIRCPFCKSAFTPPADKPKGFFEKLREASGKIVAATGNSSVTPDLPGLLAAYSVTYRGGHYKYLEAKRGFIDFNVFADRFEFTSPLGASTEKWFEGLMVQFQWVLSVELVERKVGTTEAILSRAHYHQHKQKNNIVITYKSPKGKEVVPLRVEMLTGVHIMAQADKCLEFMALLKDRNILEKFPLQPKPIAEPAVPGKSGEDIPAQIEKLAALRDKGILTEEEFAKKKSELLAKM